MKLIGYVNADDLAGMTKQDVDALDVINIAFGKVCEDQIVWNGDPYREALARVRELKPSIRILLSVGGWSADGFSQAAMTQEGRELFARTGAAVASEYGLDGIDIDWEYPGSSLAGIHSHADDRENFTKLLAQLRKELPSPRMVTIAAGGDTYFALQTDMKAAAEYLDYVQLMTYDLQGGFQKVTGHHSALYSAPGNLYDVSVDKAVRVFMNAGVPADKLVIGIPFYSRMWKGVKGLDAQGKPLQMGNVRTPGLGLEAETIGMYGPDYTGLAEECIEKNGYVRYWDDAAKAPYLYDGDCFITYEDVQSIRCKIDYTKQMGLGGAMFWELRCDKTGTLLPAIREAMDENERGAV